MRSATRRKLLGRRLVDDFDGQVRMDRVARLSTRFTERDWARHTPLWSTKSSSLLAARWRPLLVPQGDVHGNFPPGWSPK
ncbi:hypothetical protein MES4922_90074 [Mesorhizobium ventifaucium]|uniref:Uncharacterized protein n=1 Tax=Mesorhizobium ventifaucium TaxID=666020 RepID=A0ABN8KCY8_9HYPH|nr:hypothetical protein MES4922_90074 [Mesorhizobium ventifaucium]